jgi:hypothetical protein
LASAYYFGSAESPTADFLLVWLKSSRSDPRRYDASQTCRPQVGAQLRPLCFYERRLSHTVPARSVKIHAGVQNLGGRANFHQFLWNLKILSPLLSVLSLHRKFVHDHCCCPNSATILTDSKMEAVPLTSACSTCQREKV